MFTKWYNEDNVNWTHIFVAAFVDSSMISISYCCKMTMALILVKNLYVNTKLFKDIRKVTSGTA